MEGSGKSLRRQALENGILAWLAFGASAAMLSFSLWEMWYRAVIREFFPHEGDIVFGCVCLFALVATGAPCGYLSLRGYALAREGNLSDGLRLFCIASSICLADFALGAHLVMIFLGNLPYYEVSLAAWLVTIAVASIIGYIVGKAEVTRSRTQVTSKESE